MQVVQFVDVADVHLLFVQLSFVEVLTGAVGGSVMNEDKKNHKEREREGDYKNNGELEMQMRTH